MSENLDYALVKQIDWGKNSGLIPTIIQNAQTHAVLMLGYMNQEALQQTLQSKMVTFYSRSKKRLWVKGESSGNYLELVDLKVDCDHDTLLIAAIPKGPTCHRGTFSCFDNILENHVEQNDLEHQFQADFLLQLENIIAEKQKAYIKQTNTLKETSAPEQSYTISLFKAGIARIAQKVGEEGVEVALAAVQKLPTETINETADLLYHVLVLLQACGLSWQEVLQELARRHQKMER